MFGVLDHVVTTPTGQTVYVPMRVIADGDASEVVFTLRRTPGMSDADVERDVALVTADLELLKAVLEPRIGDDEPQRPDVLALLDEHLADMYATSPAESVHALDPTALSGPDMSFWTARDVDGGLLGCVALKELGPTDAELKSMRTATRSRGRGVGTALLTHVLRVATERGYASILLETGTQDYFAPARRLYERAGFAACPPFADYRPDPSSAFYRLALNAADSSARARDFAHEPGRDDR